MNRCAICGRKLKNSKTTCGLDFCKVCERYEQQLADKDKELNNLKELRKLEVEDKKELRENRSQEVIKLEKALAEKDKEIERLKEIKAIKNEKTLKTEIDGVEFTTEQIMVLQRIGISLENHDKQIRHQVCEEIREKAIRDCIGLNKEGKNFYHYVISPEILDQIERAKGEKMSDLIKQCDECKLNECINCEHSWADIQELKEQLAEKDKTICYYEIVLANKNGEIKELRTQYDMYRSLAIQKNFADTEFVRSIRRQVCEEIRKEVLKLDILKDFQSCSGVYMFEKILDQIEQGEYK